LVGGLDVSGRDALRGEAGHWLGNSEIAYSPVRPGKKPANTGIILTNEKTQDSEEERHF
jgi:hypothetical protein